MARKISTEDVRNEMALRGFVLLSVYKGAHDKLDYTCPNGHVGAISYASFKSGKGCLRCANNKRKLTQEEVIKEFNLKHGTGTYDYSNVNYIGSQVKVIIICEKHGKFYQRPNGHLQGAGCKLCDNDRKRYNQEDFILKANAKHGVGTYDYNKVNYVSCHDKITITCPKHGDFNQNLHSHLMGHGCSKCAIVKNSITKEGK